MHFVAVCKAVSCRKSEGKKASGITRRKKCRCPSELQSLSLLWGYCLDCMSSLLWALLRCPQWGWPRMCCVRSGAELSWCSPGTAAYLCIPCAPCMRELCLPAFLLQVHGNKPVLCPLMIKCAIMFCLIGCVFVRWSPDRQFGVAQWLVWFAVYKLVWEVANASLAT